MQYCQTDLAEKQSIDHFLTTMPVVVKRLSQLSVKNYLLCKLFASKTRNDY